jgi:hypothetical protein
MCCLDDSDGAELAVNQLVGTYRVYQFRHGKVEHIQELKTGWTGFTLAEAKQVRLGELDDAIVASSDHGTIYVYGRMSGSLLCKLRAFPSGSIPVIAVSLSTSSQVDLLNIHITDRGQQRLLLCRGERYGQGQRLSNHCMANATEGYTDFEIGGGVFTSRRPCNLQPININASGNCYLGISRGYGYSRSNLDDVGFPSLAVAAVYHEYHIFWRYQEFIEH